MSGSLSKKKKSLKKCLAAIGPHWTAQFKLKCLYQRKKMTDIILRLDSNGASVTLAIILRQKCQLMFIQRQMLFILLLQCRLIEVGIFL